MAAKVISSVLIHEASTVLEETGKAATPSERTQAAQFNSGLYGGRGRCSNAVKPNA